MNRYVSPILSIILMAALIVCEPLFFNQKGKVSASAQTAPAIQSPDSPVHPRTITILGTGNASTPADMAYVRLTIGGSDGYYGPSGPEFKPSEEEDLLLVARVLEENGIETDTVAIDAFSAGAFGPSSTISTVSFIYPEPTALSSFLADFLEAVKDEKGPKISGAMVLYLVEDCAALESAAMGLAIDNARLRAEMMATQMDEPLGNLMSLKEGRENASFYGSSGTGNCASLERSIHSSGMVPMEYGTNSADEVEVSITVQATFAVE